MGKRKGKMMSGIKIINMHAKVGNFQLKNINLSMDNGHIFGLLGVNGAGKTTLFKTLMGMHLKTKGEIIINGMQYKNDELKLKNECAMVFDISPINPFIKGKRLNKIYQSIYDDFDQVYFESLIQTFQIPLNKRLKNMSLGMQKKLHLSLVLARRPKVMFLDEPFIGIDPIDKQKMMREIQTFMEDEKHIVVISSHFVEDVEKISDYIAIIHDGTIKSYEEKDALLDQYVYVKTKDLNAFNHDIKYYAKISSGYECLLDIKDINKYDVEYIRPSLEKIFILMSQSGVNA